MIRATQLLGPRSQRCPDIGCRIAPAGCHQGATFAAANHRNHHRYRRVIESGQRRIGPARRRPYPARNHMHIRRRGHFGGCRDQRHQLARFGDHKPHFITQVERILVRPIVSYQNLGSFRAVFQHRDQCFFKGNWVALMGNHDRELHDGFSG